jgi:hypothetical protein
MHSHVHMIRQAVEMPRGNAPETLSTLHTRMQRDDTLRQMRQVVRDAVDRLHVHRPSERPMRFERSECGIVSRQLRHETGCR